MKIDKKYLDKLVFDRKFDELLDAFNKVNDESLLFYKVIGYLGKGDYKNVLETIENNKDTLVKYEPVKTIKLHVKTLVYMDQFSKAFKTLDYYKNLPYISQEVEETFQELDKFIESEEDAKKIADEELSLEELNKILEESTDIIELYKAYSFTEKYEFKDYKESIKKTLINDKLPQELRSVALAITIDNKCDEELDFLSIEGLIKVKPLGLIPPHQTPRFKTIYKFIEDLSDNDFTVKKNALNIFNLYNLISFPSNDGLDEKDIAEASIYLSKKYMANKEVKVNDKINEIATKIEKIIS